MNVALLEFISCPDPACGAVAEVVDTVTVGSTSGPVPTFRTLCLRRHTFVVPADRLEPVEPRPARRPASR